MRLTPEMLLRAYAFGIFPMGESRANPVLYWIDPEHRGILPLECFHLPRRLRRTLRAGEFTIRCDSAFEAVIDACAEPGPGRPDSWINRPIRDLYCGLAMRGFAHSVETWIGEELVGGLYGVALGGAFFGESMFSRRRDASKVALTHLVARLSYGGFELLDTQFVTKHLARFGAIEIPREDYQIRLTRAIAAPARFHGELPEGEFERFLQSTTQTS